MQRQSALAWLAVCALTVSACTSSPETMTSPSGSTATATFANPDGSTVKVGAPRDLGPNGVTVATLRPTLTFTNPSGVYLTVGYAYDIEVQTTAGVVVYSRVIGESPGSGSHTLESDLSYATNYEWRVRARLGTQVGPWAALAAFRTFDAPVSTVVPPTGGGAGLPFAIPSACGPGDPSNRFACAAAVAAVSAEWRACASGVGIGCHRFTRQVVFALAQSDPNWKMITASPGGNACNCSACGPSDGTMFREDTTVYGGNRVFDMIVGAGGSSPSLTWSAVVGPRAGDIPADAPLCR